MTIKLPQNQWRQYNRSSWLGDLDQTYNCDLTTDEGVVAFTRTKINFDEANAGATNFLQRPVAFEEFSNVLWVMSDGLWWSGNVYGESGDLTEVSGTNSPTSTSFRYSDMDVYNGALYVSTADDVRKTTSSPTSWTQILTGLTNDTPHLMTTFGDRLYITDNFISVLSTDSDDVLNTSTGTLDLAISSNYSISFLEAGNDRIWIGTTNDENKDSFLFEWDGETQDLYTRSYHVPGGVVAGCIHQNRPYIVNTQGRLLTVNGTSVQEVDRFPLDKGFSDGFGKDNSRNIHPNGMISDENRILILATVESAITSTEDNYNTKAQSGVWEYSKQTGLNHKFSLSESYRGQTDYDDFGVGHLNLTGALYRVRKNRKPAGKSGWYMFGADTYVEDISGNAIDNAAMFYDEDVYETKRAGYFTTVKIPASRLTDFSSEVALQFRPLSNGTYTVKYRTEDREPQIATVTWLSETQFNTTDDLSNAEVGDEVEVVWGKGAGTLRHIEKIETSTNVYSITLDGAVNNAGGTSSVRVTNFKKAGEYSGDLSHDRFPVSTDGVWIQFKVYYEGVGRGEVYGLLDANNVSRNI